MVGISPSGNVFTVLAVGLPARIGAFVDGETKGAIEVSKGLTGKWGEWGSQWIGESRGLSGG